MATTAHAWWDWGYGGIFICVFLEQIGVPIPAVPALLAAGALVTAGELNLPGCLLTALAAALLADLIWYQIGRVQGGTVLNLMCRLSWRPDTCVTKTQNAFTQYGVRTLLFSKFIPGLSVIAPPLSGMTRVPLVRFVVLDGLGAIAWALVPLLAGGYLQKVFALMKTEVSAWRSDLPWLCGALIVAVLAWRFWNRRAYRQELARGRGHGIDVMELKSRLDDEEDLILIDVRDEVSARAQPVLLPHARWIPSSVLPERSGELALDKPIILYCDCPHDESSTAMADWLRAHGARRAHSLRGGLAEWLRRGWPTAVWSPP